MIILEISNIFQYIIWLFNNDYKINFPQLDGIRCEISDHNVSDDTGKPTLLDTSEADCPGSTSCAFIIATFLDADSGKNKNYRKVSK